MALKCDTCMWFVSRTRKTVLCRKRGRIGIYTAERCWIGGRA